MNEYAAAVPGTAASSRTTAVVSARRTLRALQQRGGRPPHEKKQVGDMASGTLASRYMEKFLIEGGYPLSGTVVPAGNKNAALPVLAACLLTEEEVVVRNVPRIRDVEAMLSLLEHLGVEIEWREDCVSLCAAGVDAGVEVPL